MANSNNKLKAYVRYDGSGRVIAGSLILQRFKPKVGNWEQIGSQECCDPFCLPPVYGEDYIIDDIVEGETGITVIIETNPFTNPTLQVAAISCESEPPGRIIPLNVETIAGNIYSYFIPDAILEQTCAIGFRRICVATQSGWTLTGG
jgi:hypothetical protein